MAAPIYDSGAPIYDPRRYLKNLRVTVNIWDIVEAWNRAIKTTRKVSKMKPALKLPFTLLTTLSKPDKLFLEVHRLLIKKV